MASAILSNTFDKSKQTDSDTASDQSDLEEVSEKVVTTEDSEEESDKDEESDNDEDEDEQESPEKPVEKPAKSVAFVTKKTTKASSSHNKASGMIKTTKKASSSHSKASSMASSSSATRALVKILESDSKKLNTKDMIIAAVSDLNDKKGSTIPAIKKYMVDKFDATDRRLAIMSKLLKNAGEEGWLDQITGTGASSGSHFKLPAETKKEMLKIKKMKEHEMEREKTEKIKPVTKVKVATKRKPDKLADKEVPKKKTAAEATKKKAGPKKKAA